MTRPTAADAMARADQAMNEIGSHERECALRYKAIEEAVREMRGWLIGTFAAVLMLALSLLGFFALRYFDTVTKPQVQSVQVQTTVK